jgi:hypothetical protein
MSESAEEAPPLADEGVPPVDPALAGKPICKVRSNTRASMAGKTQKDRSKFASDKKLKDLLATADNIQSMEHFMYWKDEFLSTFRHYLDPQETANAREADEKLYVRMQKLAKLCLQLKEFCADGNIAEEGSSVKGQRAVNEFVAELARSEKLLQEYFPKTKEDEDLVQYNKFNLAAVLVRDGFRVYDLMVTTRDYILNLRDGPMKSEKVLNKNHRSVIQYYLKQIDTFCDCLADLGMYKLMNKCVELFKIRPRKNKKKAFNRETMDPLSDTSDDQVINNGRMFRRSKIDFKSIMDNGWTSGTSGQEVKNPWEVEKGANVTAAPVIEEPEEELPDPNKPNEWIYYYDPATEKIGKIPRKRALKEDFIIKQDKEGTEEQEGAVQEWDGKEGKDALIWVLKDACKGKTKGAKK